MSTQNLKLKCDKCWRKIGVEEDTSRWRIDVGDDKCPECIQHASDRWLWIVVVAIVFIWGLMGMPGVRS